jgi:Na+/phosphate symporter
MVIIYFGIFYNLYTMEHSANPLKESKLFNQWIASLDSNP